MKDLKMHFILNSLNCFFFKTWLHIRFMAIVYVSSHLSSTRTDCSIVSLRRSTSSLITIRVATGTFIEADAFLFKSLLSLYLKSKKLLGLDTQQRFFEMRGYPSQQSSQLREDF